VDKELLIKKICEAEHNKKKPGLGKDRRDDNSIGKVLRILSKSDGNVHPTELCRMLEVTTPRITVILNDMEEKGLVERLICKDDRRKILVVLTEKGRKEVSGRRRKTEEYIRTLVEKIGPEDSEAYLRILQAEAELYEEAHSKND
jgi:DNA-binding MarR family transcriptional regulator